MPLAELPVAAPSLCRAQRRGGPGGGRFALEYPRERYCDHRADVGANDARAIIAIATLAADIDLEEVRAETVLVDTLAEELCVRAQISPATLLSLSPLPLDKTERASRIRELAGRLPS